ncbi:MAG: ribonuclease PH [Anaerolineae bacterium]
MRHDGRAWNELRPVRITTGFVEYAEGSVLIECGGTRVLCNATVEPAVPAWRQGSGAGWVTAEYALLPRSTQRRTRRERMGLRGRTQEIQRLIGRCLRQAVDLDLLGERQIIVDCDVLQADGGTRTASITGGYVALALALRALVARGLVPAGVLIAPVAAVSLGLVDGRLLLDLDYQEDSSAGADFNLVMTGDGRFVEVQGTAEGAAYDRAQLDAVLDLAAAGIEQLLALQQEALARSGDGDT